MVVQINYCYAKIGNPYHNLFFSSFLLMKLVFEDATVLQM